MNALLTRCRHIQVNWLDTHSCHCQDCGKTGHWFEPEGLVMWVRGEKNENHRPFVPTNVPLQTNLNSGSAFPSRAG